MDHTRLISHIFFQHFCLRQAWILCNHKRLSIYNLDLAYTSTPSVPEYLRATPIFITLYYTLFFAFVNTFRKYFSSIFRRKFQSILLTSWNIFDILISEPLKTEGRSWFSVKPIIFNGYKSHLGLSELAVFPWTLCAWVVLFFPFLLLFK